MFISSILPISTHTYQKKQLKKVQRNEEPQQQRPQTAFKGWNVKVLELSEENLKTVAKAFYKSTEEELRNVTEETTIGIKQKNKSLAAYYRLKGAVDKAKLDVDSIKNMIQTIERKSSKNQVDMNSLVMLNGQLKEYEDAFANRMNKYYTSSTSSYKLDDDWEYQELLAKADGGWYDY